MVMRQKLHKTDAIFTLLLLLLFSVCSLLLILIGYHVYKTIDDNMDNNNQIRSSFYYLSNKIRSNEAQNSIEIMDVNGVEVLSINQSFEDIELYSYIYFYDHAVREQLVFSEKEFQPEYGEIIIEVSEFTIDPLDDGLLRFTIKTEQNQDYMMQLSMQS